MAMDYVQEYANEIVKSGASKQRVNTVVSDYREGRIGIGKVLSNLIDVSKEAEKAQKAKLAKLAKVCDASVPKNTRLHVFDDEDGSDVLEIKSSSRGELDDEDPSPELQRAYDDLWQTYWTIWEWAGGTGNERYQRVYGYLCEFEGVPGVTIIAEFDTSRTAEAVQKAVAMAKSDYLDEAEVFIGLETSIWCDWDGNELTFSEVGIFVPWNTAAGDFAAMWCAHGNIAGYSLSENQDLKQSGLAN